MKIAVFCLGCVFAYAVIIAMCFAFCGCSVSLTNISTHGTATDLVDEYQTTDPNLSVPLKI